VSSTPNNGFITVSFGGPTFFGGANPPVIGDNVAISRYEASIDGGAWSTVSTPFTATGTNGTEVSVDVRAVNNFGLASGSVNTKSTPRTVTTPPTSFSANSATFGQITLSWGAPTNNNGSGVSSYVLRNGTTVLQNSTATSYTHTGLAASTTYSYTVTAVNAAGESTASSISATTIGGYAKVWNGSSWVTLFPKIWNGSSWDEAQARVWNGSEWKHGI
jgi:chitinase